MLKEDVREADLFRPVGSWLSLRMPAASAGYMNQIIRKGHLTVNGLPATEMQPLLPGDTIELKESGRTRSLINTKLTGLEILFEDSRVICLNKPNGLAMHAAAEVGPDNLVDLAAAYLCARERASRPHAAEPEFRLRPVNRLDRGTSGAVILAKSSTAAGIFGKLVMEEGLGKLYLAVGSGRLVGNGEIFAEVEGKDALTRYRALYAGVDCSLVALWPKTGRMHQIRQHMRSIGHPILGDRRYGGPPLPAYQGFTLHAFRTSFIHPDTGTTTVIHAPLPPDMLVMLRKLTGENYQDIIRSLALLD